jgi:hypothetical protein
LRFNRTLGLAALAFALAANMCAATTVFDQLYPARDGELSLPYPFSALIDDLRARSGAELQVGFIPLGRSLQRFAADPDYFASPRIILAVSGNGSSHLPLRDRLFMGYQPAVNAIEIIAFDDTAGQFRFLQIEDYRAESRQSFTAIDEATCVSCHQSRAPIFPASPWDETNANARIAAMLPTTVQGLAVRQDFDGIDQFSRSVHRANRLVTAAQLKRALSGKQPSEANVEVLAKAFPEGISIIDPKIPNRDPSVLLDPQLPLLAVLQAKGIFDPETPRRPHVQWLPGLTATDDAARLIEEADAP